MLKNKIKLFRKLPPILGLIVLSVLVVVSMFPELFTNYSPDEMFVEVLLPPCHNHIFGTDGLGRDLLTLLVFSTRMTFLSGVSVALFSGCIGIFIGCLSGISNSSIDGLIVELINLFSIIPSVFIILMVATTGKIGFLQYVLVASFSFWTGTARLMRSQVISTKELPFIQTLFFLGERMDKVVLLHIIPNCVKPVITNIALTVGNACILECGLSYIGVNGLNYSLGMIMNHGQKYILSAWWITGFPIGIIVCICGSILTITDIEATPKLNPRSL